MNANQRRLQQLADAMPQLVWMSDAEGTVRYFNSRAREYAGLSRRDDGSWSWHQAVHWDDLLATQHAWEQATSSQQPYQFELRMRMAGGGFRWHLSRAVPTRNELGQIEWIGTATDIHDLKTAEQTVRRSQRRLAEALDVAHAANRSRGEFLANMSHEIRTPMAAILGYADLLHEHVTDPDDRQCVETIQRNGQFLLELINDILDFSKIDAGRLPVSPAPVCPDLILEDVVSLMQVRAGEKGLQLDLVFASKVPTTILSDGKRLRQILLNLVSNAIKFTSSGSVRLITRLDVAKEQMQFDVVDTGIGIEQSDQQQLFEPFTQIDASSTRAVGGAGLGLAISRRLATFLGGGLVVESEVGRGSTFSLTIDTGPLDDVELVDPRPRQVIPERVDDCDHSLHANVLVVDDRREIRFLAQHLLEEAGCNVETANNGKEAIELVGSPDEGNGYDLIVMDMQMPVMDGYQASQTIRRQGIKIPIIALTASAMRGDREKCLSAGCTDFTTKPLDKRDLMDMITKYVGSTDE